MNDRPTRRILLVEDNPGDADLAIERLAEAPHCVFEVLHVSRLSQLLESLRQKPVDAIVLDLNLPDSDGFETLRRARQAEPNTPIIVLSGSADDHMREMALAQGAQDIFGKSEPYSLQFARSIAYAIEKSRADRQYEQILRLVSAMPDAVIVSSVDGTVHLVNRAALELFGKSEAELLTHPITFSVKDGETAEIEILCPREVHTAEVRTVMIDWQGKPAFLASLRDVTAKKRMEREILQANLDLEQANRQLSDFASLVAHDLKAPLLTLLGYARLCTHNTDGTAPAVRENLQRIVRSAERMDTVIGEIRRFSACTKGELCVGRVDTHATVSDLLADMRFSIEKAGATINVETLPKVEGNATLIRQVFQNLIENALKFRRPDVAPVIGVTAQTRHGHVRFCVRDNGIGIPPKSQPHVFQLFKRAHNSSQYEGSGIGLAICERIIQRHRGRIWLESEPEKGTAFFFVLPESPRAKYVATNGSKTSLD